MLQISKVLDNLAWLVKELEHDLQPTRKDSTIPTEGGTPTTSGAKPPTNLATLDYKIQIEAELRDLITQVIKATNIRPQLIAERPVHMWCTWLSHNTHLIMEHTEPDVIEDGFRTIEQELHQRHDREPAPIPHGKWWTIQQAINEAHNRGVRLTRKQIHNWRARGYVRAFHSLDGDMRYSSLDILGRACPQQLDTVSTTHARL